MELRKAVADDIAEIVKFTIRFWIMKNQANPRSVGNAGFIPQEIRPQARLREVIYLS